MNFAAIAANVSACSKLFNFSIVSKVQCILKDTEKEENIEHIGTKLQSIWDLPLRALHITCIIELYTMYSRFYIKYNGELIQLKSNTGLIPDTIFCLIEIPDFVNNKLFARWQGYTNNGEEQPEINLKASHNS